jgi:AcrR family transcriptional regulator
MVSRRKPHSAKVPQQARSKETVELILRATAHILRTDGYARCSTNRVAQKAGVSVGSLYQYFSSREVLVTALAERHVKNMQDTMLQTLSSLPAHAPFEKTVRALLKAVLAHHARDPALHRVLVEQVPQLAGMAKIQSLGVASSALVQVAIERQQKQLRPLDAKLASHILVQSVRAVIFSAFLEEPPIALSSLEEELVQLVIRYLGHRKVPGARSKMVSL